MWDPAENQWSAGLDRETVILVGPYQDMRAPTRLMHLNRPIEWHEIQFTEYILRTDGRCYHEYVIVTTLLTITNRPYGKPFMWEFANVSYVALVIAMNDPTTQLPKPPILRPAHSGGTHPRTPPLHPNSRVQPHPPSPCQPLLRHREHVMGGLVCACWGRGGGGSGAGGGRPPEWPHRECGGGGGGRGAAPSTTPRPTIALSCTPEAYLNAGRSRTLDVF